MANLSDKRAASSTSHKKGEVIRSASTGRYLKESAVKRSPRSATTRRIPGSPTTEPPQRAPRSAGTTQWDHLEERILAALRPQLHVQLRRAAVTNVDPNTLGSPDDIAASMVAVLPASHPFDDVIGPFYDTAGLTRWLDISRQALHQRVKAATVLGCPLDDGTLVYPVWQFLNNGASVPGLAEVLKALHAGTDDPWQIALWLSAPNEDLDGMPAREWLRNNRSRQRVLALAHQTASRWAQ
ncbi:hypothetical protein [Mycolicibacterium gadium]|uniref:DNA-binding protein n=1 Tax=Mycolicibacterium gadium TaxID=1794 RepID=A0ABT6GL06_MYCGU|nr:hypothetical protein [Mycolicibacterium gadium]MDG5481992.1 hypothetical protein [Mycolicibacterium gadium]